MITSMRQHTRVLRHMDTSKQHKCWTHNYHVKFEFTHIYVHTHVVATHIATMLAVTVYMLFVILQTKGAIRLHGAAYSRKGEARMPCQYSTQLVCGKTPKRWL